MNARKEVIVVSPDQYKDLARKLSHEISKTPGCTGAFWTIKKFEENEFQLGGNRYAIFIGNAEENSLTKDFLLVITNIVNQAGSCYGFDGAKAVVFGEGNLSQSDAFKAALKNTTATGPIATGEPSIGADLAIRSAPFLEIIFPVFGLWRLLGSLCTHKIKLSRDLRKQQTKAALTLFLTNHFDKWLER